MYPFGAERTFNCHFWNSWSFGGWLCQWSVIVRSGSHNSGHWSHRSLYRNQGPNGGGGHWAQTWMADDSFSENLQIFNFPIIFQDHLNSRIDIKLDDQL